MQELTTPDGRTLAYEVRGSGEPLVCHPGGPGFSGGYMHDLGGLAGSHSLVVLDPRGTGGSDPGPRPEAYALADYAADLEALHDHLGLEQIDLLGHSHGSLVAIRYAADHPERVRRLVLATTCARFQEEQLKAMEAAMQERAGEPWFADASAALQAEEAGEFENDAELAQLVARELPFYFADYGDAEKAFVEEVMTDPVHAAALGYFNEHEFMAFDLRPLLPAVTASTLVVAGERDFILGPAACAEVADGIAGARLELLDGVGHMLWVEAPDRFAALVGDFLAS
ncbi:MAG TPA: alpha/beta hydrolase [Thermoleophilaceae bacterium]|jgi:pimeloyl-ACP methyl ester carboxylesterase